MRCHIPICSLHRKIHHVRCCGENYRQFDFWVGNWETVVNERLAGTNHIVFIQDSCVIQENWKSATSPYTGTSYNYYDPQDDQWHQTWVDNQGQSLRLAGKLKGDQMILQSEAMKNQIGETIYHRITWTPNSDGTVRQHWQSQRADSNDWQTVFDGIYKRKS